MEPTKTEVVVVGAGPGGYAAAFYAADLGKKVILVEQDKKLGSSWDWLQLKRDQLRQVLGFFIGEPPVDPFDQSSAPSVPVAAAATGLP